MDKAPDAYRTISEVGEDLDLPQHVLRFWETRFTHIKPLKRGGGRRYYRPDDVELLKGIRHLLYKEGYTIKGVQRILKEQGPRAVMAFCSPDLPEEPAPSYFSLPQAVSPPPAYAPQPAPLAAPVFAPPPPPPRDVVALVPDLPGLVLPPLEVPQGQAEPEAPFELPHTDIAAGALADDAAPPMMVQNPEPAPVPAPAPSQVSMFRGGLQRSEPAAELPLMVPAAAPTPVSYTSSTYAQPVSAPPGHARVLLLQALEELSVVRGTLDRLLATRAA